MEGEPRELRDLELGLIRLSILAAAAREPVYGTRLLEELMRRGFPLRYGTLYPMLHRLAADGLLVREDRLEGGHIRKYYRATPAGRDALARARRLLDEARQTLAVEPEPAGILIDLDAYRAWQAGAREPRPTLLDVRSAPEYTAGHLPGARLLPAEELSDRLGELERERPVVTYCTMRHRGSARSERAASLLRGHGYRAWALDGGLPAWVAADLPLEGAGTVD